MPGETDNKHNNTATTTTATKTENDDKQHEEQLQLLVETTLAISNLSIVVNKNEDADAVNVTATIPAIIACDAGYGFPSEPRPRKEKILAVAKQIVNFLKWQRQHQQHDVAVVKLLGCNEADQKAIKTRMEELWKGQLPENMEFSLQSMEQFATGTTHHGAVYLSPDAETSLDPNKPAPSIVVVGMLIDRRVQLNRSLQRAECLGILPARLQLENFNIDNHEPLNVDVVMETMQQWWWNGTGRESYMNATEQAIQHHCERHPNRPLHTATTQQQIEDLMEG